MTTARHYTDGTIAPHIIGITGKLNESEYKDRTDAYKAESADQNLTTEQKPRSACAHMPWMTQ